MDTMKQRRPSETPCVYHHKGYCRNGSECQFSHGPRPWPGSPPPDITPRYKTEPCRFYGTIRGCGRGDQCTYAHGPSELRSPSERSARHTSTDSSPGSLHATGNGILYRGSPAQACPEFKAGSNVLSPAQSLRRQEVFAQLSSGTASAAHNCLPVRRDEEASAKFGKYNEICTLLQELITFVDADVEGESCFQCPINFERFKNPVVAADGHTYELDSIKEWMKKSSLSPSTLEKLENTSVIPNWALRRAMEAQESYNKAISSKLVQLAMKFTMDDHVVN
eukprot:jgi/Botrbrau1/16560/Bobra.0385s0003.1